MIKPWKEKHREENKYFVDTLTLNSHFSSLVESVSIFLREVTYNFLLSKQFSSLWLDQFILNGEDNSASTIATRNYKTLEKGKKLNILYILPTKRGVGEGIKKILESCGIWPFGVGKRNREKFSRGGKRNQTLVGI